MMKFAAALCVALSCTAAMAQGPSVQQQFEGASAALKAGNWNEALAGYGALEKRLAKTPRSLSIVRVRKGEALRQLDRDAEAAAAIKAGLAGLPANDASLREDRFLALTTLGEMDLRALDYASAHARFKEAERFVDTPVGKARVLALLIQTGTFIDLEGALADSDRAMAHIATMAADKAVRARFSILRARVLLNLGRYNEAQAEGRRTVNQLGGLGLKVDHDDIVARSDYALAAMLAGDKEEARKYLAYTGAGRLPDDGFGQATEMRPPPCGGTDGLQPDDVGVVEFSIREDGSVGSARPIYSSRRGESALEFARAVANWSWTPEKVKKIDPFYRALTRIELRCSTTTARPSVASMLTPTVAEWVIRKGVTPVTIQQTGDARRLAPLREELARREKASGVNALQLVPVLAELSASSVQSAEESVEAARRALTIVEAGQATPIVRLFFSARLWQLQSRSERNNDRYTRALEGALFDPGFAADPVARSALRLITVDAWQRGNPKETVILLKQVVDDAALAPNDPFRVGALVRLASHELQMGNAEGARTAFEQSGLSARQCALIDGGPALRADPSTKNAFPSDARRWGFGGWALVQYDVAADGKTVNQRPLVAYPPFVFGDGAKDIVRGTRYEESYRPDGGLGCGGNLRRVIFRP